MVLAKWQESRKLLSDLARFPEFAERYLRIRPTGGGRVIPFKLNTIQRYLFEEYILPPWIENEPIRVAVLKMRQSGISTLFEALAFWYTLGRRQVGSMVISEDDSKARRLFDIIKRFLDNLPDDGTLPKFAVFRDSLDTLAFDKPRRPGFTTEEGAIVLGSTIEVKSAQVRGLLARGVTSQFIHASECAWWPALTTSLGSMLPGLHDDPRTMVFLETTANGYNEFHDFWVESRVNNEEISNTWQLCFIPWYWDRRYEEDVKNRKCEFRNDYEEYLFELITGDKKLELMERNFDGRRLALHHVWRKIFWRRSTLQNKFFGDEDFFKQEYFKFSVKIFVVRIFIVISVF